MTPAAARTPPARAATRYAHSARGAERTVDAARDGRLGSGEAPRVGASSFVAEAVHEVQGVFKATDIVGSLSRLRRAPTSRRRSGGRGGAGFLRRVLAGARAARST